MRIGWRLTLWHAAVVAAILLAGGLVAYWSVVASFRTLGAQQLDTAAATVAARLGDAGDGHGEQAAINDVDLLRDLGPVVGEVVGPAGGVVNRSPELGTAALPVPAVFDRLTSAHDAGGQSWLLEARDLAYGGRSYTLVFGTSWQPMAEILEDLRRTLLVVGLGGTALAIAGGAALARATLARVDAIRRAAEGIGATDLSARLPVRGPQDELGRLAAAFNAMLDRIEESQRRQAAFVADASHELRTPTTIIRGLADMLRRWAATDPEVRDQALETIARQSEYLGHLVGDLLTLARGDAGAQARSEPIDLGAFAREMVRDIRPIAGGRRVEAEPITSAVVRGDPVRLRQMVGALLDNALRFTSEQGCIRVSVRTEGRWAVLSVQDDGPGIAPEDLPHIFDRFFRGAEARARARGGAGLGLAIAQAVATEHGGEIAAGPAPGGGTIMTVRLPLMGD